MRVIVFFLVIADLHRRINGYVPFSAVKTSRGSPFVSPLPLSPVEDISLGAPYSRPLNGAYISAGGVKVDVEVEDVSDSNQAISDIVDMIDNHKGEAMAATANYASSNFCDYMRACDGIGVTGDMDNLHSHNNFLLHK